MLPKQGCLRTVRLRLMVKFRPMLIDSSLAASSRLTPWAVSSRLEFCHAAASLADDHAQHRPYHDFFWQALEPDEIFET